MDRAMSHSKGRLFSIDMFMQTQKGIYSFMDNTFKTFTET